MISSFHGISSRELAEMLAERGVEVDHTARLRKFLEGPRKR